VILRTRGGCNRAERYPLIVWSMLALRVDSIVLDSEVAVLDTAGISDFDALHTQRRDGPPKVVTCAR
jgi:ATP-dependent DNA ligase